MSHSAAGSASSAGPPTEAVSGVAIPELIHQTNSKVAQVKAALVKIPVQDTDRALTNSIGELFSIISSLCEYLQNSYDHVLSKQKIFVEQQIMSDKNIAQLIEKIEKLKAEKLKGAQMDTSPPLDEVPALLDPNVLIKNFNALLTGDTVDINKVKQAYQEVVTSLKQSNQQIQNQKQKNQINMSGARYYSDECTDEEPENNPWIQKRKRKKGTTPQTQSDKSMAKQVKPKVQVDPKPPPIYLHNVTQNYKMIEEAAREHAPQSKVIVMRDDQVKINAATSAGFRNLSEFLRNEHCEFHTYQDKQTRPYAVMIKGIHKSLDVADITQRFQTEYPNLGEVKVVRKIEWKTKKPLDMCIFTFANETNIDDIHAITSLHGAKVKVENIKASKLVAQCRNCQGFGHTKNYCGLGPRCVKCGKNHKTMECTKPEDMHPRCANCKGQHPASYRGCQAAIEAQSDYRKKTQKQPAAGKRFTAKTPSQVLAQKNEMNQAHGATNQNLLSYQQVLQNLQPSKQKPALEQMQADPLKLILDRLNQIEQRFTELDRRIGALENKRLQSQFKKSS